MGSDSCTKFDDIIMTVIRSDWSGNVFDKLDGTIILCKLFHHARSNHPSKLTILILIIGDFIMINSLNYFSNITLLILMFHMFF